MIYFIIITLLCLVAFLFLVIETGNFKEERENIHNARNEFMKHLESGIKKIIDKINGNS